MCKSHPQKLGGGGGGGVGNSDKEIKFLYENWKELK